MEHLIREIQQCRLCPEKSHDIIPVPGEGNYDADIMFIGELPPEHAHLSGSMFSGPAGRMLEELINLSPVCKDDIYVTSLLKCTLFLEGDGVHFAVLRCIPFIFRQISLISPSIICPLGKKVFDILTEDRFDFHCLRGKQTTYKGRLYFPLFNPAEAFYNYNLISIMEKDFINLGSLYNEHGANRR